MAKEIEKENLAADLDISKMSMFRRLIFRDD